MSTWREHRAHTTIHRGGPATGNPLSTLSARSRWVVPDRPSTPAGRAPWRRPWPPSPRPRTRKWGSLALLRRSRAAWLWRVTSRVESLEPAVDVEHGVDRAHGVEKVDVTGVRTRGEAHHHQVG